MAMNIKSKLRPKAHTCWPTTKFNARSMAQAAVLAMAMAAGMAACGSKDSPIDEDEMPEGQTMKVNMKEMNAPEQPADFRNVRKDDYLFYKVKLLGTGNAEDYIYRFNLNDVKGGPTHNERIANYYAWLLDEKVFNEVQKNYNYFTYSRNEMREQSREIKPNKYYVLRVQPTIEGAFKLNFSFTRTNKKTKETQEMKMPISFYCTSISAFYNYHPHLDGVTCHYGGRFRVEAGHKACDTFLRPGKGKTLKYEIRYDGKTYTDNFVPAKPIVFFEGKPQKGPGLKNRYMDYVIIHINETGKEPREVRFDHVKLRGSLAESPD